MGSGFSLAQAGDKPDGETAMEDLESARVQMVEKIKSISDFIEREIENENSKKSEAYRRKREVNGVHWGKGKKHRRGRGEENIEEPIEESEAQEESIESPKEDEELEESIELEETEEPEGEEPEGEEPEGEEPEGEEPIVSSTEDEEQEEPGEIDIGEEEEITIGEPEEEIEANNEETPVSDFKGHPLDNFSTEQITDMMNHMTSLKNSFDLLISAFNDFKDGSPASDGETVDYQPGEESPDDDMGPLEETEDEALTDTRGGDPYNEESEEQVEEEEGHASGGGPENYESEGGAEPYESEDGAEDGAEPYEPEGGAEDGAEPYEPEGGAETYESGESDVVEPEVPEVEKEEDMEESEDIEESEDKEDSEDIEESEDKEESEDIEESENMEGSDDNEVKKSEESSDLEEELKAGDEEIEGEVSGEGIAESGEDTGMNEEAGGYMEPTEEEIPEPNLPSMY